MASAYEVIEQLAWGGLNADEVNAIVNTLRTGRQDPRLQGNAANIMQYIWEAGLDAGGVDQTLRYLTTGVMPADVQRPQAAPAPAPAAVAAPAPAASSVPTGPTEAQRSAKAIVENTLAEFGLQGLGDRVWGAVQSGQIVPEQITSFVRQTDEYKQRFAGMAALQAKGRAISEAEYISTERSYAQVARAAGLPSGFYDSPDDFSRLIGGEVSPAEFAERVQTYTRVALQAPQEVRDQLQRLYGVGPGELTAFVIDPDRALPMLQNRARAAEISAAGQRTGFGGLQASEAERLASLGVSDREAQEGFGALVEASELFTSLDAGEDAIGRDSQIGAVFEGNARARSEIEKRRARRKAQFEGGGGYARTESGFSGIGTAS